MKFLISQLIFLTATSFCYTTTTASKLTKTEEGIYFAPFGKIEGNVLLKNESFLSRSLTSSKEECVFKCVHNPPCLSVNAIQLDDSPLLHCEMFNWTATNLDGVLVAKSKSFYMYLKQPPSICDTNPCGDGGQCSVLNNVKDGYECKCNEEHTGENCTTKCVLFDFESGRLDGWTLTGTAFNNQPTYGDNPKARYRHFTASLKGNWWIGGYENRPSPSDPPGQTQGDAPTGTMTSPMFQIKGSKITFLIGGCGDVNFVRLELLIGGSVVAKATGANSESMVQKSFDVKSYRGKTAQLRLVDAATRSVNWGHINVDHIVDSICTES